MTSQQDFFQYIIAAGVEAAAPQYGTTVTVLKNWMRGDAELDPAIYQRWVDNPRVVGVPEEKKGDANPGWRPAYDGVAPMQMSSLASRVLNEPGVRERLKAETRPNGGALEPPGEEHTLKTVQGPTGSDWVDFEPPAPTLDQFPIATPERSFGPFGFDEPFVVDEASGRYSIWPARTTHPITVCLATNRDIPPAVFFSFIWMFRKYELGIEMQTDTMLPRARNMVASRALAGPSKWLLWLDSDMMIPIGNPDWFRKKSKSIQLSAGSAGLDLIERLLAHKQPLVGGVYAARSDNSQMVIQPDIDPRTASDFDLANRIRRGQQRGLSSVEWLGFGCALVHRRVFEAVRNRLAGNRPGEVGFFDTEGSKGEDVAFCERAKNAGFQPQLDCELVIGHLGRRCYLPEHSVPLQRR
jgi:hypothetical protein